MHYFCLQNKLSIMIAIFFGSSWMLGILAIVYSYWSKQVAHYPTEIAGQKRGGGE